MVKIFFLAFMIRERIEWELLIFPKIFYFVKSFPLGTQVRILQKDAKSFLPRNLLRNKRDLDS